MRLKSNFIVSVLSLIFLLVLTNSLLASSHREAPLISSDPLADNVDVYAFRSPDDPNTVTLIATYVPMQLPHGGPNYYSFGKNIRYEVHVDNDASKPGDEIVYRFTFDVINEDPTTFFNIRLGKQNQKTTYTLERSVDGGLSFATIVTNGVVPPNNIGDRSITGGAGLNTTYGALFQNAITTATTGEKIFAGPTDDPFFVDLGGIFDLGDAPRQGGKAVDGLACYNVSAIAIQVPISTLLKDGAPATPTNILDSDYVIGVWASASRQAVTTLSSTTEPTYSGDWVQVSRLGMPLTNEAVIPIGDKDFWNSITPYDEISETTLDKHFFNPELALYMDDDLFGGAVPALAPLRIQKKSLFAFDFTNGANGLYDLKGNAVLAGTALDDAVFGTLLLPGPGMPRSVDLWPAFHTGVPNVIPYQLATGKNGNPLAAGKPFVNNFLPNGGDMLRLNMAVPVTPRNDPNFSSLGLIQAAAIGLTVAPYNTTTDLEFIPNMDGFPNGRRLEDDVTRIELQAVAGVVLAAVGLWYDDYDPSTSPSPVTQQLLNVLTYTTGVEKNDLAFQSSFPYLAMPHSGTGDCSGEIINPDYVEDPAHQVFVSSNTQNKVGVFNFSDVNTFSLSTFDVAGTDADGIHYDKASDVLYQLDRTNNVINAYSKVKENLDLNMSPVLTATSTSNFTNGREIAVRGDKLVVAQDADASNGSVDRFIVYNISPTSITLDKSYDVSQALWGIHLDGNTLYAVEDLSDKVLRFDNFFELPAGMITPNKTVAIESMVRTHGITYDRANDIMILTDVAAAASATDGAFTVINGYTNKALDNVITVAEQIIVEGPLSLMGNPVDIAYDKPSNRIYIAERAKDGGRLLGFNMPTASGDAEPVFNEVFAGASALFLAGELPNVVVDPAFQVFVSSNTQNKVGVYNFADDNTSSFSSFNVAGNDADGIYYDKDADVLYQLNRSNNVINAYSQVAENLALNLSPVLTATSTSDFTNGREIAVRGDKLVVAQDADASNGSVDRFIVYTISPTSITLDKAYDVSQALWGIHLDGNTLYAVEDVSEKVLRFDNFFDLAEGNITPDQIVAIESMVRTHGITYDREGDVMILTDVAAAASATDGAFTVIRNYNTKASDNVITEAEQIIVEGPLSLMGNPVDIAFDRPSNRIYIAERAKDGGRVLGFEMPTASGDVAPIFNEVFAGASAIFLGNQRVVDVIQPEIVVFDPNFTDDILVASRLLGSNEVPAVVTDAIGVATVTFNDTYTEATLNVTASNLSSAFTGLHIHNGIAGENGPVLFDFTGTFVEGRSTSTFAVTKDDVAALINGEYYLNVHTANNPNGELRGQLALESSETFSAILDGSEEIPAVNTPALGIASAIYTANTNVLELNILATNLSGPITGFHLHRGASGTTGPVVQNLESFVVGSTVMVKLDAGDYIAALRNGDIYVNIHTEAYPNGEIRGQLIATKGLYFDTWMDGKQEVPAVENDALGLAIGTISSDLTEMSYALLVDNPTGPFTAAHIHKAALGEGGGVVLDLDDDIFGQFLFNEGVAITPEFLADYLRGDLYFNVHTAAAPNGEVRGQLYRVARDGYVYDLCQEQEVDEPVNAGNASGSGMFAFNRDYDEAHLMAVVNQLSSTFQGSHIHNGAVGTNGPVVFDFTQRWSNSGSFFYVTEEFTSDLAAIIQSGNAYVNIHTTNNPGGEVRGQLVKAPDCPFSSAVVDVGGATFELEIYPNPVTTNVQISFDGESTLYQNSALEIRDLTGRLVFTQDNISNNYEVDMSNVQSGVYVLSLSNKAYSKSFRIVKL
jgi:hypothetical protein